MPGVQVSSGEFKARLPEGQRGEVDEFLGQGLGVARYETDRPRSVLVVPFGGGHGCAIPGPAPAMYGGGTLACFHPAQPEGPAHAESSDGVGASASDQDPAVWAVQDRAPRGVDRGRAHFTASPRGRRVHHRSPPRSGPGTGRGTTAEGTAERGGGMVAKAHVDRGRKARRPAGPAGDRYVVEIRANAFYVVDAKTGVIVGGPYRQRHDAQARADAWQRTVVER